MHAVVNASPKFKGKSKSGLFGDSVEEFDYETERLLDTLDALSLRVNTFVIYTSDDNPHQE